MAQLYLDPYCEYDPWLLWGKKTSTGPFLVFYMVLLSDDEG